MSLSWSWAAWRSAGLVDWRRCRNTCVSCARGSAAGAGVGTALGLKLETRRVRSPMVTTLLGFCRSSMVSTMEPVAISKAASNVRETVLPSEGDVLRLKEREGEEVPATKLLLPELGGVRL